MLCLGVMEIKQSGVIGLFIMGLFFWKMLIFSFSETTAFSLAY